MASLFLTIGAYVDVRGAVFCPKGIILYKICKTDNL
jgi:hypothetical protein